MTINEAKRLSGAALLTLLVGALAIVILVWWRCGRDPDIRFLTAEPPAEWIIHPTPFVLQTRQIQERRVRFRTAFDLPSMPKSGQVRLRAFRQYALWINGTPIGSGPDPGGSWKRSRDYEVVAYLQPGKNRIEVEVTHVTAPPALWLVLSVDQKTIKTARQWQARAGAGDWVPVRLATEPWHHSISQTFPTVPAGWRDTWHLLLLWLGIALGATGFGWWASRRTGVEPISLCEGTLRVLSNLRAELALLGLVVVLWIALCANNLCRLPPVIGFDSPQHLEYIHFIKTHHRLPLASDGFVMCHPPLYYLLSGVLIAIGRWLGWADAHTALPKLVSMVSGLAQVILVWWTARIVFPDSRRARCVGLVMAAAMPMNLYMAQYLSNEMMCTALVTASLVLALRIIRDDATRWTRYVTLGGVLGLALLTKYTALLAVVTVLIVVGGTAVIRHRDRRWAWLTRAGMTAAMVGLLAGWVGVRNWIHFRTPLAANWDPATGCVWWQDPGYRTSAYYLRFGRSLTRPFFSGLYSYGDGIYSTVWGDGQCAGVAGVRASPPWHYKVMTVGYTLALFPTALITIGLILALIRWVRRPTAAWALLGGHGLLVGSALCYMTLKLPYYSVVKGFYGLTAMACLCAFGARGFDLLSRWLGRFRVFLWIPLLVWAINAYVSFFVWPLDPQTHHNLGAVLLQQNKPDRAVEHFRQALQEDPDLVDVYAGLGSALSKLQRFGEARQVLADGLIRDPDNIDVTKELAWLLATCPKAELRDGWTALRLAQQACDATRYKNPLLLNVLAAAQAETGQFTDAVQTLRRAIRLARSTGSTEGLSGWRALLGLYETGRPYRQAVEQPHAPRDMKR